MYNEIMSEVEFKEEWQMPSVRYRKEKRGFGEKLADLIMKSSGGLIKNQTKANYVILTIVAVMIIVSFFLIFSGGGGENLPVAPKDYPPAKF